MSLTVRHIMASEPKTLTPAQTAFDAAGMMLQYDIGAVPIVDGGRLVGLVTDRDLVVRVLGPRLDAGATRIDDIATSRNLVTIEPGATLAETMDRMAGHKVKRLPVVHDDELVGVVSMGDVANASSSKQAVGETVAQVLESPSTLAIDGAARDPGTPDGVTEARHDR
jgi:CBS domain-containing protein